MSDIVVGTSVYPAADTELSKEAGIVWVRHGFLVPGIMKYERDSSGASGQMRRTWHDFFLE